MAAKGKTHERLEAAKERAKNLAKAMGHGMKSSAIDGVTGAGAFYVAKAASDNIDTLKKPYYLPAVLFVGGHVLGRRARFHNTGVALKAVGGFLAAQQWEADRAAKANQTATTTVATQGGTATAQVPAPQAKGWSDAMGGVDSPGWTAMLGQGNAGAMGAPELPTAVYGPTSQASYGGSDAMGLVSEAMGLVDG